MIEESEEGCTKTKRCVERHEIGRSKRTGSSTTAMGTTDNATPARITSRVGCTCVRFRTRITTLGQRHGRMWDSNDHLQHSQWSESVMPPAKKCTTYHNKCTSGFGRMNVHGVKTCTSREAAPRGLAGEMPLKKHLPTPAVCKSPPSELMPARETFGGGYGERSAFGPPAKGAPILEQPWPEASVPMQVR